MNDSQQKETVALVTWLQTFPSFGFEIVNDDWQKTLSDTVKNVMEYLGRVDTAR
jgi:hypothetical protein